MEGVSYSGPQSPTHLVAAEPLMSPETDLDAVVTTAAAEGRARDLRLLVAHPVQREKNT